MANENRAFVNSSTPLPPIDIHPGTRFLAVLLGAPGLNIRYEPVVRFADSMTIHSLSAVVGGPEATSIDRPGSLRRMVHDLGLEIGVDRLTATTALKQVGETGRQMPVTFGVNYQTLANDPGFDDLIERACERFDVPMSLVTLAIRYRSWRKPTQSVLLALDRLRRKGLSVALDDVGRAPTDDYMIEALEPQFVLIDSYWVTGVANDPVRSGVLSILATKARRQNVQVVAKGVTTPSDLDFVRSADVDLVQGLLVGAPSQQWLAAPWRGGELEHPRSTAAN